MSAGNLYRTFPSKEAIVEGLCAVDQAESAPAPSPTCSPPTAIIVGGDVRRSARTRVRQTPREGPHDRRDLGRGGTQPASRGDDAVDRRRGARRARAAVRGGQSAGAASPALDPVLGARFFFTYVAGLFRRIATEPDFDREAETAARGRRPQGARRRRALRRRNGGLPMSRLVNALAAVVVLAAGAAGYATLNPCSAPTEKARALGLPVGAPDCAARTAAVAAVRGPAAARRHRRAGRTARIRRPPVRLGHARAARGGAGRRPHRRAVDRRSSTPRTATA